MKLKLIICVYISLLIVTNLYYRIANNTLENNTSSLVILGKENHEELFKNTKGIKSYRRSLSFYPGLDNDIIYTPEVIFNPDGSSSLKDEIDDSKLTWSSFSITSEGLIPAYEAKTCNVALEKDEVVLKLLVPTKNQKKFQNYLQKKITFKYKNKLIPLSVKEISEPKAYSYICISNELYKELISQEENYIFEIESKNYRVKEKIKSNWSHLEANDFYGVSSLSSSKTYEQSMKLTKYGKIIDCLQVLNFITAIILGIIAVSLVVNILSKKINKEEENKEV